MIFINEKINGQARERILIAAFRWLSDIDSKQFEQSCIIFQASEEQSAGLQIADLIARLKIKPAFLRRIVQMIIRRDLFKVLGLKIVHVSPGRPPRVTGQLKRSIKRLNIFWKVD